jgi:PKD repeat protein
MKTVLIKTGIAAHKYTKAGKYTVTLTVKNAAGSNTMKKTNYITAK